MLTFKIIIAGFGKMASDCLKILHNNSIQVNAVIETEASNFSSLQAISKKAASTYYLFNNNEMFLYLLTISEPTIIFSINNNYIFPPEITQKKHIRIVNFHNSLLHRYRGHGLIIPVWVVYNEEKSHGVTWHLVTDRIDSGNIISQQSFSLSEDETALTVMKKSIIMGTELFENNFKIFLKNKLPSRNLLLIDSQLLKKSQIPNQGVIDLSWNFFSMHKYLRCMDYGPFSSLLPKSKFFYKNGSFSVNGYDVERNNFRFDEQKKMRVTEIKLSRNCLYLYYGKTLVYLYCEEVN